VGWAFVIKQRISKHYRISELDDKMRKQRTKAEVKILEKLKKVISAPDVQKASEYEIQMSFIDGKKLSQELNDLSLKKQKEIMKEIGKSVAKMHEVGIIHGDLTTSNMISKNKEIFLIDFGLGFQNGKIEDKGVDIHLLKQALEAKHFENWKILFAEFEKAYKKTNKKDSKKIFERLNAIERRGRYKNQ